MNEIGKRSSYRFAFDTTVVLVLGFELSGNNFDASNFVVNSIKEETCY